MYTPTIGTWPAEWEPHEACWLAYPHRAEEWSGVLEQAQQEFIDLCRRIEGERLEILVPDERTATRIGDALHGHPIRTHVREVGDCWTRDTAPLFVRARMGLRAVCFQFNGWGGKYDMPGDRELATWIAETTGLPAMTLPWVAEGGALEVDGDGTLLTTRQCLRNANRNPGRTEAETEAMLCGALGVSRVLWLDEGLLNDHTDGHIDTLARFVSPGVVVCMEPRGEDPNAAVLDEIARALRRCHDAKGRQLHIERIPSPGLLTDDEGSPLPASYCNYYVANHTVVVPTYGSPHDDEAVERIAALFPGRKVVGSSARAIIRGGGAFHCMTQQQPKAS